MPDKVFLSGIFNNLFKIMRNLYILLFSCLPILACSQGKDNLKDKFSDYFLVGATINQEDYQIIDKDEKVLKIVSENFNSLTPENSMKWMHSHPEYSKFTFSNAQKITCLLYTSPSPRDGLLSRMPSSA